MKHIRPIYIFILLMLLGAFLSIGSYDLGKRTGTREIVRTSTLGMKEYKYDIDEDKINAYTESYRSTGCIVLLIGGIGLITVLVKEK